MSSPLGIQAPVSSQEYSVYHISSSSSPCTPLSAASSVASQYHDDSIRQHSFETVVDLASKAPSESALAFSSGCIASHAIPVHPLMHCTSSSCSHSSILSPCPFSSFVTTPFNESSTEHFERSSTATVDSVCKTDTCHVTSAASEFGFHVDACAIDRSRSECFPLFESYRAPQFIAVGRSCSLNSDQVS
jgi:hypothetical protein